MIKNMIKRFAAAQKPDKVVGMSMDYTPQNGVRSLHARLASGRDATFTPEYGFSLPVGGTRAQEIRKDMFRHLNSLAQSDIPSSARENILSTLSQMQRAGISKTQTERTREDPRCDSSISF